MLHAEYATIPPTNAVSTTTVAQPVTPTRDDLAYTGGDMVGVALVGSGLIAGAIAFGRIRGRVRPAR